MCGKNPSNSFYVKLLFLSYDVAPANERAYVLVLLRTDHKKYNGKLVSQKKTIRFQANRDYYFQIFVWIDGF